MTNHEINIQKIETDAEKIKVRHERLRKTLGGVTVGLLAAGAATGVLSYRAGEHAGEQYLPSGETKTVTQELDSFTKIGEELNSSQDILTVVDELERGNPNLTKDGHVLQPGETVSIPINLEETLPQDTDTK